MLQVTSTASTSCRFGRKFCGAGPILTKPCNTPVVRLFAWGRRVGWMWWRWSAVLRRWTCRSASRESLSWADQAADRVIGWFQAWQAQVHIEMTVPRPLPPDLAAPDDLPIAEHGEPVDPAAAGRIRRGRCRPSRRRSCRRWVRRRRSRRSSVSARHGERRCSPSCRRLPTRCRAGSDLDRARRRARGRTRASRRHPRSRPRRRRRTVAGGDRWGQPQSSSPDTCAPSSTASWKPRTRRDRPPTLPVRPDTWRRPIHRACTGSTSNSTPHAVPHSSND